MLIYYLALIDDEPSRSLFEEFYLSHRQTMVYVANQILHDQALAEDVTHDAFLRIINHLEKISDAKCNKTRNFIVLIVRNIALDYYRKSKRLAETSYDDIEFIFNDEDHNPEELFLEKEAEEAFGLDITKLHPNYALILAMKYSYEYTNQEIALMLNTSEAKVRMQLHRARKRFKEIYYREGD